MIMVITNLDVGLFCCLSYSTESVLGIIRNATEEQIKDPNWLADYWKSSEYQNRGVSEGNLTTWYHFWKFLKQTDLEWKHIKGDEYDTDVYIFNTKEVITIVWRGTEAPGCKIVSKVRLLLTIKIKLDILTKTFCKNQKLSGKDLLEPFVSQSRTLQRICNFQANHGHTMTISAVWC